jgi:UDP-N-acetylmuramate--alanine ligase
MTNDQHISMSNAPIKVAHFVGVGGIGVSAILRLFADHGISVSGSDIHLPDTTRLPAGKYFSGHAEENVPIDADVLVYSPAAPAENPERVVARMRGIPELSYPEALALVTKDKKTIAISGTHGKSTTTALAGRLFEEGGLDPSVIVGAEVPGWKERNLRRGASDLFILEACEYRRNMLKLEPQTIVLTNIELDHPDYYHDLADVKDAFREYVSKLSGEDLLVVNNDDANIRDVIAHFDGIIVRYGVGEGADLVARNIRANEAAQTFELVWHGTSLGELTTPLPGLYNIYNILAATAVYLAYGGKTEAIGSTLLGFLGVGRRFEVVGKIGNALVVSDYAHHPTALAAVVDAASARFLGRRICVVFRPHHRERTQKLFDHFVEVIAKIPYLLLVEIYDVPGREEGLAISAQDLIRAAKERTPSHDIAFAPDLSAAEDMIRRMRDDFDVFLIIGAGDADTLAQHLVTHS